MPPFVLVRGPRRPVDERRAALVAASRAQGWIVVRGWAAPLGHDRIVCTGWIRSAEDAGRALLAAVAGAGLIVGVSADLETVDRLVDDLRRLGSVEEIAVEPARGGVLAAEQRALLGLLAEGLSIGAAATELGVDRETATRRLAAARRILGVRTTAAAIAAMFGDEP